MLATFKASCNHLVQIPKLNKISRQHYWKSDCVNQSYQENHMSLIIHIVCPCVLSSLIVQLLINILVGSRFLRYVLVILSDTLGFFLHLSELCEFIWNHVYLVREGCQKCPFLGLKILLP